MDEALIRYKNVYINQQELGVLEDVNLDFFGILSRIHSIFTP